MGKRLVGGLYRSRRYSTNQRSYLALLGRLHLIYLQEQPEQPDMAYSMEEFLRETHELIFAEMTVEERLRGLDLEECLRVLEPDEIIRCFSPEERLRGLEPEDILRGIDLDVIESWLAKAKAKRGEGVRE